MYGNFSPLSPFVPLAAMYCCCLDDAQTERFFKGMRHRINGGASAEEKLTEMETFRSIFCKIWQLFMWLSVSLVNTPVCSVASLEPKDRSPRLYIA